MDLATALAGALTGFLVGLTGVGGGALMTPVLLLVFGVAPLTAVGTDLWFAAITKMAAAQLHHRLRLIEWPIVRRLWAGSLPASALTLAALHLWAGEVHAGAALQLGIGAAVVISALGMFAHVPLQRLGVRAVAAPGFRAWQAALTSASGAAIGALVTLTSVGAGALGAVVLAYLYPRRLTSPRLVATDIMHAIPLAVFAGLGHLFIGNVDGRLLVNMLLGSVPAVILGARLSTRLPHGVTRALLAALLTLVGMRLLWRVQ